MTYNNFAVPFSKLHKTTNKDYFKNLLEFNFLSLGDYKNGCECTISRGLNFTNPFFADPFSKLDFGADEFYKTCYITPEEALKLHEIDFRKFYSLHLMIKELKPMIYIGEWIKANKDAVGCTYRMVIKLKENNNSQIYNREHKFTETGKIYLDLTILNYERFDTIQFCHYLKADKLSSKRLQSIKVGGSFLKIESESSVISRGKVDEKIFGTTNND